MSFTRRYQRDWRYIAAWGKWLIYVIFNTLIGNHDAHAKNFSLIYTKRGTVLAPLYDALSTAVYANLTDKMAMNRVVMNEGTQRLASFAQALEECVLVPSGQWRPP